MFSFVENTVLLGWRRFTTLPPSCWRIPLCCYTAYKAGKNNVCINAL